MGIRSSGAAKMIEEKWAEIEPVVKGKEALAVTSIDYRLALGHAKKLGEAELRYLGFCGS